MNSRTLAARVKDFDSLIMDGRDAVPLRAVRKLYKITMELVELINHTESRLATAGAKPQSVVEVPPVRYHNPHANQMKEMAEEMDVLRKELAELKEENRFLKLPKQVNKPIAPKAPSRPKTPTRKK